MLLIFLAVDEEISEFRNPLEFVYPECAIQDSKKNRPEGGGGGEQVVPEKGFEPSRPYGHCDLNAARLPIPPLWH